MDGAGSFFALWDATYSEDDFCSFEGDEVTGCFEAETDVGAGYDDGLVGEGSGWDGQGLPLVFDEGEDCCHGCGCDILYCF